MNTIEGIAQEFRLLDAGEWTQPGDECEDTDGTWFRMAPGAHGKVIAADVGHIRRPMPGTQTEGNAYNFTIGEQRHTSAGNVFRLEWIRGTRVGVRRIGNGTGEKLWDEDEVWTWCDFQWDSLPLIGETSHDPTFGLFIHVAAK